MNAPVAISTRPIKAGLTVENFLVLNDAGAFESYRKTELIDGEIWAVNAQHTRHARTKTELAIQLGNALQALGSQLRPLVEVSTRIGDDSLPEPDIVITGYKGPDVVPPDMVALVIEVADSTLDIDLGRKLRLYARAGIPEYWVVDLDGGMVRQMWSPEGERYRENRDVVLGGTVEAATICDLSVLVPVD